MHPRTLTPDESSAHSAYTCHLRISSLKPGGDNSLVPALSAADVRREPRKISNIAQSPVQGQGFRAVTPKPRRAGRKANSRSDAAHPSSSRVEPGSTRERWGQRPDPNPTLFSRATVSPVANPPEELFCRAGSAAPLKGPGRAGEWGNSFLPVSPLRCRSTCGASRVSRSTPFAILSQTRLTRLTLLDYARGRGS